jgi:hypothetical protein
MVPEQLADIDLKLKIMDRKAARAEVGLSTGSSNVPAKGVGRRAPKAAAVGEDEDDGGARDLDGGGLERPRWEREHVAKSTRPTISIVKTGEGKTLLEISMLEARNRQLEDVLAGIGSPVKKVTRVGIGPLRLKGLGVGQWRELTGAEVSLLRKIAKQGVAKAGGVKTDTQKAMSGLSRTQRKAKLEKDRQGATGFGEVARAVRPGRPGFLGAERPTHARKPVPAEDSTERTGRGAGPRASGGSSPRGSKRRKHDEGAQ